ncbi:ATP-binding cassette G family transporter ABCG89 [Cardiosporidium cionae]|uniref:ATP-binding cassette G family transporter ABCG89 n=1 Tax=Cardiosporidium cionae TaxID=476202 RepID=A0ABQ7JFT3_9APIC|nr:ATP-binding cassette G family transporter ABCG89 [Cardiosporidium cionae]|eukprot:KAF8822735.1 ATP-binding cassette G family transporter ABCG89 [Cardiosporidium cionae]
MMDPVTTISQYKGEFGKPCIPIQLEFQDISVEVFVDKNSGAAGAGNLRSKIQGLFKSRKELRTILRGISGKISSGDFVAVMGASGAGKSTLLRVLSGYNDSFSGRVLVNGKPRSKNFHDHSCFIQQEDAFLGYLTTEEHLYFQSRVRIPHQNPRREESVQLLLSTFGLNKIQHSLIGNVQMGAKRGISGGEKKRLSVATELLTNPSIIFADEPTSGLDAFTAEAVVTTLGKLAKSGRCVIATIHQPSSEIFSQFNKLLLLSEGRLMYFGDPLGCISYFLLMGHMCPPYANPADYIIETLSQLRLSPSDDAIIQLERQWRDSGHEFLYEWETKLKHKFFFHLRAIASTEGVVWMKSKMWEDEEEEASVEVSTKIDVSQETILADKRENLTTVATPISLPGTNFVTQFHLLLKRALLSNKRNPLLFHGRLLQSVVTALLVGLVFLRLQPNDFLSKNGAAFLISINQIMLGVMGVVGVFSGELPVVKREFETGKFNVGAYFFAKTFADFFIVWFLLGLNDDFVQFILAVFYIFLGTNAAISLGYLISALSPTLSVAMAVVPIVFLPMVLISGFLILLNSLPAFWSWLVYLAPMRWIWSGIMLATWKILICFLLPDNVVLNPCPPNSRPPACFNNGQEVLLYYGLEEDSFARILTILLLQIVVFRTIAFFGFVSIYHKKVHKMVNCSRPT